MVEGVSTASKLTINDVNNNAILAARGARCTYRPLNGVARCRKLVRMSQNGGITDFRVFNTDIKTSLRGVLERLFFVKKDDFQPTVWPSKATVHGRLAEYKHNIVKFVGKRYRVHPQTIVDMYNGSKKTTYTNAMISLQTSPVTRKDSYLQTFIKVEKTNFTAKSDPVPRIIQPRHHQIVTGKS